MGELLYQLQHVLSSVINILGETMLLLQHYEVLSLMSWEKQCNSHNIFKICHWCLGRINATVTTCLKVLSSMSWEKQCYSHNILKFCH